jgi:type I restriction enzyme S subunit
MASFQKSNLGKMLSFYNGKSIKPGGVGKYPVYGSNGLIGGNDEYKYDNGIIIGRVGAYCGSVQYCSGKLWASDNTIVAKPQNDNFDIRFLYYLLWDLNLNKYAGGAAQPLVTQTVLKQVEAFSPPLETQNKIASVLSTYDDLIENNTKRIKILEEMAQAIYREWFVNFRFPGHEKVKMVGSSLGEIPDGWGTSTLSDLCHITMGQSPKSEFYNEEGEGLPFHQGVADYGARFPSDRIYCKVENRIAEAGDILFSVRAPVGRLNITTKKIVIGRGLCGIRSKTGQQAFIFQQLVDQFKEEDQMGGGTIFKSVTKQDVFGIKMITPSAELIEAFETIVNPIFRDLEVLTNKNKNLRQTRDLLLPKLISGQMEINT